MLKIGLTGGVSSGKSTVCKLFSALSIPIIDADIIARELVEPNQIAFSQIVTLFGEKIVQADGMLNRSALRNLIFSDPKAKKQLENILHPKIKEQLYEQSHQLHADYCILAIPLLIESHLNNSVDRILVIDIEPEQQLIRLCHRDNISRNDAQKIINSQCNRQQRLALADDVISNDQSIDDLKEIVANLDKKYREIAKSLAISCQHADSHGQ